MQTAEDWPGCPVSTEPCWSHRPPHFMPPGPKRAHSPAGDPLSTNGRPEGSGRKGMLKSAPSALHSLHCAYPHAEARKGHRSGETRPPEEEGRAALEAGACAEHHPRDGVFPGDLLPRLPRWEEEGWSGAGARATPLNIREQPCEPSPLPRRDAPAGPGAYT